MLTDTQSKVDKMQTLFILVYIKNTALVQLIGCEPLSISHEKIVFSHTIKSHVA